MELRPNGLLFLHQGGLNLDGTYSLKGQTLEIAIVVQGQTSSDSFQLSDGRLVGLKNGSVWDKQR